MVFSRKHVGVLYLLVRYIKTLKVRDKEVKTNITEMEAVRLRFSSVGLSNQLHRHEVHFIPEYWIWG
jgi:hypothetical protein